MQCRMSSSRLPAKCALDMHGRTILERAIERCSMAQGIDGVVVATSNRSEDDCVARIAARAGVECYQGSLQDVRGRYLAAAERFGADAVVRVTADNPYVEPSFLEELAARKRALPALPYAVHRLDRVVYGTAGELFDVDALIGAMDALPERGREHVTTGLAKLPGAQVLEPASDLAEPALSLTIDTLEEYQRVWQLARIFGFGRDAVKAMVTDRRTNRAYERSWN